MEAPITPAAQPELPVYQQPAPSLAAEHPEVAAHLQRVHAEAGCAFPLGLTEAERRALYWSRMAGRLAVAYEGALKQRDALRATLTVPDSTLTITLGDTAFEVAGAYHPEERGDAEEPGCAAWFEATDVYVRGVKLTRWISDEQFREIEVACLAQCEANGREARSLRRAGMAGEVL